MAVLCDENPEWQPDHFGYGGWGSKMSLRFPIVKILDYADQQEELAKHDNPIAHIVLAHLKAMETRRDPNARHRWKIQLVKGLYEHGWSAEDVRQLFRLIDWLMDLPKELQEGFREEMHRYEEDKSMPYVTSIERLAKEEGRQEGLQEGELKGIRKNLLETIEFCLRSRYAEAGLELLPKIQTVENIDQLRKVFQTVQTADDLNAIRERVAKLIG
jgi:hypothetical protein